MACRQTSPPRSPPTIGVSTARMPPQPSKGASHAASLARGCLPLRRPDAANRRPGQRKSQRAITRDILDRLLAACHGDGGPNSLVASRDAALLVAFASGGRRRSEIAALRVEQLSDDPQSPALQVKLGRPDHADRFSGPARFRAPISAISIGPIENCPASALRVRPRR